MDGLELGEGMFLVVLMMTAMTFSFCLINDMPLFPPSSAQCRSSTITKCRQHRDL